MSVETMSGPVEQTRVAENRDGAARSATGRLTRTLLLVALPAAAVVVLLNVAPLFYAGWESLHLGDMIAPGPFAGLQNYAKVLAGGTFWAAALFTLVFAVVGVFGSWAIGLGLALLLRTRIPLSGLWRALLLLPWIIPIPATAQVWSSLAVTPQSPLPALVHALGFGTVWFSLSPTYARVLVCVFRLWVGIPFMMLMMSSALASVDRNVYEAAQVDGAGRWQTFTRITLPLISRTSYISWILMTILCVNDYPSIANLTAGGPLGSTQTLVMLAWNTADIQGFVFGPGVGQATAIGFLMTLVLVAVSLLLYRMTRSAGDGFVDAASMGGHDPIGARAKVGAGRGRWWRLVAILFITALLLLPVGRLVYFDIIGAYSYQGGAPIVGAVTLHGILANLASLVDPVRLAMFWRSALLASVTVIVCVAIGAPAGYAIARGRGRAISAFTIVVFAVQSFPVLLLLWPMLMLTFRLHVVAPWLGPLPMVQLIYIGVTLGFAIWMFSAFLKSMPIELEEAAWVDGCSVIGAFFRVVLPNAIPAVISTGMFVFLFAWGDWQISSYFFTSVFGQNVVGTLGSQIDDSLAFLLPPLVIFFVFNRYFSLGGVATSFSRR